jgi:hypothetical protein
MSTASDSGKDSCALLAAEVCTSEEKTPALDFRIDLEGAANN